MQGSDLPTPDGENLLSNRNYVGLTRAVWRNYRMTNSKRGSQTEKTHTNRLKINAQIFDLINLKFTRWVLKVSRFMERKRLEISIFATTRLIFLGYGLPTLSAIFNNRSLSADNSQQTMDLVSKQTSMRTRT